MALIDWLPKMNVSVRDALILFLGSCACCAAYGNSEEMKVCSQLTVTYFAKPLKETIQEFTSHDLDTQYTIYRCGSQYMHPPTLHLAEPFASQGQKAAVFLKEKLDGPLSDTDVRDILRVFVEMERQHTYNVRDDQALMSTLREKVQGIVDRNWREHAKKALREIERP